MGDVEEVDNFIDDRIPRSFIREGCGGFSGPHLATHNISRAAALRGADCPSFMPSIELGPGIVGSGSMSLGQYLATNFEVQQADFAADDDADQDAGAPNSRQDSDEEDQDSEHSSDDDDDMLGLDGGPGGLAGKASGEKGGRHRNSVFGGGLHAQVHDTSSEEEDSAARERARQKAIEEAEIDMDHFKGLIKRGHNISGTGAELADLLGVESLPDTEDSQQEQAEEPKKLVSSGSDEAHDSNSTLHTRRTKKSSNQVLLPASRISTMCACDIECNES